MKELAAAGIAAAGAVILWRKKRITGSGMLLVLLLAAGGLLCCILRGFSGEWMPVSSVEKGEKGSGSRKMRFQVQGEDLERSVTLEIPALSLGTEEAEEQIAELMEELDSRILGDNASLTEVCYPLQLLTAYPDSSVQVRWQTDAPEYLSWDGQLGAEIPGEGASVVLTGELRLQESQEVYQRQIRVFPSQAAADLSGRIQAEAGRLNQDSEEPFYRLPDSIDNREIRWYQASDSTGWFLVSFAVFFLGALVLVQQEKLKKARNSRKELLDLEYPELVSRMQMLLGAGLGMRMVLDRIAREYRDSRKGRRGKASGMDNPVYEEIVTCCRELENGVSEGEVYRRLGNRCDTPSYRGLSLLLEQNMTKGGQGLLHLLEQEALEAFENRQRRARQEGEKVSVRLLLPMGMMLVIVLALIMIPAFMSV